MASEKFLMVCTVAADFVGPNLELFCIRRGQLGTFVEAPMWVKKTRMFDLLMKDGSIKVAENSAAKKVLENDPMAGIGADGKAIKEEAAEPVAAEPEAEKPKRTRKPKGDAE